MGNYLKLFDTVSEQNTFRNGSSYVEPHVSCLSDGSGVKYNKYFDANGYSYVDLGLPSGILWATCNLGAETPESFGDYYAWGETSTKSTYSWPTYRWSQSSPEKYTSADGAIRLDLEDDAAHVNWGGSWVIPTLSNWQELKNNCTMTTEQINNINCFKFSNNNQNLIIPKAGHINNSTLSGGNDCAYYWTSTNKSDAVADDYYGDSNLSTSSTRQKMRGLSIRPVLIKI